MKQKDFYFLYHNDCEKSMLFLYKTITGDIVYYCKYCQKIYKTREEEVN